MGSGYRNILTKFDIGTYLSLEENIIIRKSRNVKPTSNIRKCNILLNIKMALRDRDYTLGITSCLCK